MLLATVSVTQFWLVRSNRLTSRVLVAGLIWYSLMSGQMPMVVKLDVSSR